MIYRGYNGSDALYRLPQWIDSVTPTGTVETNLLWKWFDSAIVSIPYAKGALYQYKDSLVLGDYAKSLVRMVWTIDTTIDPTTSKKLELRTDTTTAEIIKAKSTYDFFYSSSPIYILDENKSVFIRNLGVTTSTLSSSSTTFTLPSNRYTDEDVWLYSTTSSAWVWFPAGNPDTSGTTITLPNSGTIDCRYTDTTITSTLSSYCIYLDEKAYQGVVFDFWNNVDEQALLAGLNRIYTETNSNLITRIKTAYVIPPGVNEEPIKFAISRGYGLINTASWTTSTTLALTGTVYAVFVENLPDQEYILERLTASPDFASYHSSHKVWDNEYRIYINSMLTKESDPPYPQYMGGYILLGTPTSAVVEASYSFTNYTVSGLGTSSCVLSASNNCPIDTYKVYYTTNTKINCLEDEDYMLSDLLDTNGQPTEKLYFISNYLKEHVPIMLGYVDWGRSAHWFTEQEDKPKISTLPEVFR